MSYDAIVIGAGHNGLCCAILLAKAGRKVLVVEQREEAGGLCAERTFAEGYKVPGLLHDTTEVRTALCDSLGLLGQGLELEAEHTPCFCPEESGPGLLVHVEPDKMKGELAGRSEGDAAAYGEWRAFLERVGPVLREQTNRLPPRLKPAGAGELFDLGMRGLSLRRLGRDDMIELMRVLPMCAADWMREQFETEALSAALCGGVMLGNFAGPWSPGTCANLALAEANRVPGVKGGPAALTRALVAALEQAGGELRTGAEVAQIATRGERVAGVTLVDGEEIRAGRIVSAVDPRQTTLDLLPPGALTARVEQEARSIRSRGLQAKVHLGLSGPLSFAEREGEIFEHMRIGPHLDDLERAFDAGKYRRFAEMPHIDLRVPTARQPDLAAQEGHHVASLLVTAAPYDLEIGWSPESREALLDTVLDALERFAPGARDLIVAHEVLAPPDLEAEYGLTGGNLMHVEPALDQLLFMRPSLSLARYQTPVEGLFLAGAGSHPGGGVTLAPGALAARCVLS